MPSSFCCCTVCLVTFTLKPSPVSWVVAAEAVKPTTGGTCWVVGAVATVIVTVEP